MKDIFELFVRPNSGEDMTLNFSDGVSAKLAFESIGKSEDVEWVDLKHFKASICEHCGDDFYDDENDEHSECGCENSKSRYQLRLEKEGK